MICYSSSELLFFLILVYPLQHELSRHQKHISDGSGDVYVRNQYDIACKERDNFAAKVVELRSGMAISFIDFILKTV